MPPKTKPTNGKLDRVLFVRVDQKLLDCLERLRQQQSAESRGLSISTADVVRSILWDVIESEEGKE